MKTDTKSPCIVSQDRSCKGFSLIELLISAALSSIIMLILIYAFQTATLIYKKAITQVETAKAANMILWKYDDRCQRLRSEVVQNEADGISGHVYIHYMKTPQANPDIKGGSWTSAKGMDSYLVDAWGENGRVKNYASAYNWTGSSLFLYGFLPEVKDSEAWSSKTFFDLNTAINAPFMKFYHYEGLRVFGVDEIYEKPIRTGMIGRRTEQTATMPSTGKPATLLSDTSCWFNTLPHRSWAWMVDSEVDEYSDVANRVPKRNFYAWSYRNEAYRGGLRDDTLAILNSNLGVYEPWKQEFRDLLELNIDLVRWQPFSSMLDESNVDPNTGTLIHDYNLNKKTSVSTFKMASTFVGHYQSGKESYWRLNEFWDACYPEWPIPGETKNKEW